MAERIQLSRAKGWRKPDGAVVVSRPSKWGNPWKVGVNAPDVGDEFTVRSRENAIEMFETWLKQTPDGRALARSARRELRGKDLCCWCPPGKPCHADVLLKIANAEAR